MGIVEIDVENAVNRSGDKKKSPKRCPQPVFKEVDIHSVFLVFTEI